MSTSPVLSKEYRLFVANTASPTNDTAYTRVENENNIDFKWTADTQDYSTKSLGKVTFSGDVAYEMKVDFAEAATDTGLPLALAQFNVSYPYQIRHSLASGGTDTVYVEGSFILADVEIKLESKGLRSGTMTFKNSDATLVHQTPRALVLS